MFAFLAQQFENAENQQEPQSRPHSLVSHVAEKLQENPQTVELVSPGDICVSILLYWYDCKCSVYCRDKVTRKC